MAFEELKEHLFLAAVLGYLDLYPAAYPGYMPVAAEWVLPYRKCIMELRGLLLPSARPRH